MALLAVDLGLKTGLALFDKEGKLIWYRSRNFGTKARLKKAAGAILKEAGPVEVLVIEGGGTMETPWIGEARKRGIEVLQLHAHAWRKHLLLSRHQRNGPDAKKHADKLARQIIKWSGAKSPTSLRHDAAEAICIGLWGVREMGWIAKMPPGINGTPRS